MNQILTGPLAVAGVSTVLAFIIAILDKFLNNYGDMEVSINGGKKKLTVKGGSPLLGPGGERHIRSVRLGGRGSAAPASAGPYRRGRHLPTSFPTDPRKSRQISVGCQIKVRQNLETSCRGALLHQKVKAKSRVQISPTTSRIYLALEDQEIEFQAGSTSTGVASYATSPKAPSALLHVLPSSVRSMSSFSFAWCPAASPPPGCTNTSSRAIRWKWSAPSANFISTTPPPP